MTGRKWIGGENEVFHYWSELEEALVQWYGTKKKWYGSAGLFQDHRHVRKAVLAASRAIRARFREVDGADDRLLLVVSLKLDYLDHLAKGLTNKGENLIEMLGCSLEIVARLLGYDWGTGRPNRQVTYSQTLNQICLDDVKMAIPGQPRGIPYEYEKEECRLEKVVETLFGEGYRVTQIARMLGMSQARVKDKLVRCGKLSRDRNVHDRDTVCDSQPPTGS